MNHGRLGRVGHKSLHSLDTLVKVKHLRSNFDRRLPSDFPGLDLPHGGYLYEYYRTPRNIDVRLPGKGNSNFNGARPVHLIITMIKWTRTSRLSIKNSLSRPSTRRLLVWILSHTARLVKAVLARTVPLARCAALKERCPPRPKSSVERLEANVEPLLNLVTVETLKAQP